MHVSVIGAGQIGSTVARLWGNSGHDLMLSSRSPARLKPLAGELGATVGHVREAAEFGDAVFMAVNWTTIDEALETAGDALDDTPVLDATNPYRLVDGALQRDAPDSTSALEILAQRAPRARWTKALGHLPAQELLTGSRRSPRSAGYYCGDDVEALRITAQLISDAGFEPLYVGGTSRARLIELGGALNGRVVSGAHGRVAVERALHESRTTSA